MPTEEARRLAALRDLDVLRREPGEGLLALFAGAELALGVEGAGLALVGERSTHLKMGRSWPVSRVPRPLSFAELVMATNDLVVIEDTLRHNRLQNNPVYSTVRFLAGVPLHAPNGLHLGAFIAADSAPRTLEKQQGEVLRHFGRVAESLVKLEALEAVLAPQVAEGQDEPKGAARINLEAPQLAAALGLPNHLRPMPEPKYPWTQFDPDLVKLLFKKGAGDILTHLHGHPVARFKDLLGSIPGMNQRTLTTRLRELEARRLIVRRSFAQIPPRVEYSIAPDAQELVRQLVDLFKPVDRER